MFGQGFAESREFYDAKSVRVSVAITARRSRLHPGTRYLARGLNGAYSTGGSHFRSLHLPAMNFTEHCELVGFKISRGVQKSVEQSLAQVCYSLSFPRQEMSYIWKIAVLESFYDEYCLY